MKNTVTIPSHVVLSATSTIGSISGLYWARRTGKDETIGLLIGGLIGSVAGALIEISK